MPARRLAASRSGIMMASVTERDISIGGISPISTEATPYYSYYDYDDCEWLRYRAIRTGSSYWWRRYRLYVDWY